MDNNAFIGSILLVDRYILEDLDKLRAYLNQKRTTKEVDSYIMNNLNYAFPFDVTHRSHQGLFRKLIAFSILLTYHRHNDSVIKDFIIKNFKYYKNYLLLQDRLFPAYEEAKFIELLLNSKTTEKFINHFSKPKNDDSKRIKVGDIYAINTGIEDHSEVFFTVVKKGRKRMLIAVTEENIIHQKTTNDIIELTKSALLSFIDVSFVDQYSVFDDKITKIAHVNTENIHYLGANVPQSMALNHSGCTSYSTLEMIQYSILSKYSLDYKTVFNKKFEDLKTRYID